MGPVGSSAALTVWTAALAGLLFGYCAQRGGFCLTRALSNWMLSGDTALLRAYVLAIAVAVVGTHLLALGLVEDIPVRPFRWVANLSGGLVFGIGMVLGGGCAGSSWYRLGEGAAGAWVVLLGFAMGAAASIAGVLRPVREALGRYELAIGGQAPTLDRLVGVGPWPVVAVLVAAASAWLLTGEAEPEHGKWRWPVTGGAIGAVIVLGRYLSSLAGAPGGITLAASTGYLLTSPLVGYPDHLTWGMVLAVAVALGGAVAAWRTGQLAWKPLAAGTGLRLFAGGLLMGVGAVLADGCNITQGLTNAATLSVGSLVAFAAMLAGGAAALRTLYIRSDR